MSNDEPRRLREPTPEQVRGQLERLLASSVFEGSARRRKLLQFLVDRLLAGEGGEPNAFTIATEVLDREERFDPGEDPIVRVEIGRLRSALERFYLEHPDEQIGFAIPKGGSRIEVSYRSGARGSVEQVAGRRRFPVLAVLPFASLGAEAEEAFWAQGLSTDLSVHLSRFQELRIIVHPAGGEQGTDAGSIERDFGADFLLTGSVRRSVDRLRVTVHLNETSMGEQIWAETYDRRIDTSDVFDLQDEIARRVAVTIANQQGVILQTMAATRAQRPEHMSTYDAILRYYDYQSNFSERTNREATRALERAVERDPDCGMLYALLANLYCDAHALGYGAIEPPYAEALRLVEQAVRLDPLNQQVHHSRAYVNFLVKDADGFREAANRTFELNPNSAYTVGDMGLLIALSGDFERGIEILRQGMEWSPLCPGYQYVAASLDHYRRGAYELALKEAKRIAMPQLHWDPMLRAAALGQLGRRVEANEALHELLTLTHDFVDRARYYIEAYVWSEELVERLLDGLANAGLPIDVSPPCSAA